MSMTSTTDGFASVRESVTSRDAETTASTLDFEYVDSTKQRQDLQHSFRILYILFY